MVAAMEDELRDVPPPDESPKDALAQLDATAQAELVARGEVSESELTEAAIARVERLNPTLNAVIHPLFEKARRTCAEGVAAGPFRGVPFLVKDAVCHTEGDPFHAGMRFLKDRNFVAKSDTELARRFRAAGFVFIGKTNTPELASSVTTEPMAYGATRNPWQLDTSTGGSSGGSAAAVAAGLVPAAHANDMGGSIRVPASFCGLVGLKPTRARTSLGPHFGEYWGPLTHEHVVTRSVRDSAAILDAIAGPAPGDPYSAPPPVRPWLEEVTRESPPLRIGLLEPNQSTPVHDDCQAAAQAAASALESLGHHVEPISIPCLAHTNAGPWVQASLARDLDRWSATLGEPIGQDDVEPMNWVLAESGRRMNAAQYIAEVEKAFTWAREMVQPWANGLDVLITPTSTTPPSPLGHMSGDVPLEQLFPRLIAVTAFTMPFDVTGQPAISLPLYTNGAGMPIGVQLVAATAREDILFQLAGQLERATPWAGRLPDLHA
jgi:amidase